MRKYLLAAAAAGALLAPGIASAAVVSFSGLTAEWLNVTPAGTVNLTNNGEQAGTASIRWGTPSNPQNAQSGYDFTPFQPQPINVIVPPDSAPFLLGTFTHLNFTIASSPTPSSITGAQLRFTANILDVDGSPFGPRSFLYDFTHLETPNAGNPCAAGGSQPCPDLVTVTSSSLSDTFTVGGLEYTVTILGFSQDGGVTISSSFLTLEEQANSAGLYATVSVREVPEPASLALLGAGLMGLGVAARRRRSR